MKHSESHRATASACSLLVGILLIAPSAMALVGQVNPGLLSAATFGQDLNFGDQQGVVNGAGMIDADHHDNIASNQMWRTENYGTTPKWIEIDLGSEYLLNHLRVWNWNAPGTLDRGVKTGSIYVATSYPTNGVNVDQSLAPFDHTGWQLVVKDYVFAAANGSNSIENTDVIEMGTPGRYVAIVPYSNYENPASNQFDVGLSEVQVYWTTGGHSAAKVIGGSGSGNWVHGRTVDLVADTPPLGFTFDSWAGDTANVADTNAATTTLTMPLGNVTITAKYTDGGPGRVSLIDPSGFTATSFARNGNYGMDSPVGVFNGNGLIDADTHGSSGAFGGTNTMWLTASYGISRFPHWIKVDMGAVHQVDHLRIWNFNNSSNSVVYGMETVKVYAAVSDPGSNEDEEVYHGFSPNGWTQLGAPRVLNMADGSNGITNTDPRVEANATARYLAIVANSNFTNENEGVNAMVGLSEVKIYETDAPGYPLSVAGGTGDGDYPEGTTAGIAADPAPQGFVFHGWIGDTDDVVDTTAAITSLIMPATNVAVTATYSNLAGDVVSQIDSTTFNYADTNATTCFGHDWRRPHQFLWDGSGMVNSEEHGVVSGLWNTQGYGRFPHWVKVDMGAEYYVEGLRIWSYDNPSGDPNASYQAARTCDVYMAMSDPLVNASEKTLAFDAQGWDRVAEGFEVPLPNNFNVGPATNAVPWLPVKGWGRFLSIAVYNNWHPFWPDAPWTGLGEVKIYQLHNVGAPADLRVVSGSGSGTRGVGDVVPIVANETPFGFTFDAWIGDIGTVANVNSASTTITVPSGGAVVTASYTDGGSTVVAIPDPANYVASAHSTRKRIAISSTRPEGDLFPSGTPSPAKVFDGSGLRQGGSVHHYNYMDMWMSDEPVTNEYQWIKLDLGETRKIEHLRVWNGNDQFSYIEQNLGGYVITGAVSGVYTADIYVATSDPGNNVDDSYEGFDTNGWTLVHENYVFPIAMGDPDEAPTVPRLDMSGVEARVLAIVRKSNYNWELHPFLPNYKSPSTTLSEVQVFALVENLDRDGDGMPNDWEVDNNLDPDDPTGINGADGHADGDGVRNYDEYIADTDPWDTGSVFVITTTSSNPDGSVDVQVDSSSLRVYLLEGTNDVSATLPWPILQGPIAGTGGALTLNDATATGDVDRSYAVEVQLP